MKTDNEKTEIKQLKKWIEPKIEIVSLIPKETVMGGCLTASNPAGGKIGAGPLAGCGSTVPPVVKCQVP